MYVTRLLSMYKRNPAALSSLPPEGPNSGYLVILDEEAQTYNFFGWKDSRIRHLPFPQNKNLTITDSDDYDKVILIPVLNQPLSANRYYVIRRQGKHQGKASTCSKEEDMGTCCCCSYINDTKPKPLDPFDVYQQFEIIKRRHGFYAKSVAPDGFPPLFLRRKDWSVDSKTPHHYHLGEALGLNSSLRAKLPAFTFPSSSDRSEPVVIGKWYCPFMFVKEEVKLKDQMKRSVFYEMTLEQRWEKFFSKENSSHRKENEVFVDVVVQTEVAKVGGKEVVWDEGKVAQGVLWLRGLDSEGDKKIGLSMAIVERMKWEQERGDWVGKNEREVRFERVEKFEGIGKWENFGFYVLVESFVLKRMDGSLMLTYDFRHTNHVKCKWE